jgi:hypothetical protein
MTVPVPQQEYYDAAVNQQDDDCDDDTDIERDLHDNMLDGLSGGTLAALLQFMHGGDGLEADAGAVPARTNTVQNSSVVAETFRRLQEQKETTDMEHEQHINNHVLMELENSSSEEIVQAAALLVSNGIVRFKSLLSPELCDECLKRINTELILADHDEGTATYDCTGFGKVHSRAARYDMYLENDGVYHDALREMLHCGSTLEGLFGLLFLGLPSVFHEFSALISDPGSSRQPIHPDSKYTAKPVLYSCFVALQDVDEAMGPTWFLPSTHTEASHDQYNSSNSGGKDAFLSSCEYRKATLRKGDVAVMDSRTLHCGGPNVSESSRRVLMYFTLRNPEHSAQEMDFPPNGSKWPALHMEHADFV